MSNPTKYFQTISVSTRLSQMDICIKIRNEEKGKGNEHGSIITQTGAELMQELSVCPLLTQCLPGDWFHREGEVYHRNSSRLMTETCDATSKFSYNGQGDYARGERPVTASHFFSAHRKSGDIHSLLVHLLSDSSHSQDEEYHVALFDLDLSFDVNTLVQKLLFSEHPKNHELDGRNTKSHMDRQSDAWLEQRLNRLFVFRPTTTQQLDMSLTQLEAFHPTQLAACIVTPIPFYAAGRWMDAQATRRKLRRWSNVMHRPIFSYLDLSPVQH